MSGPITNSMAIIGQLMDLFIDNPLSQFSLLTLKRIFPGVDMHRYLLRLEEDDVLIRSKITCNGKPVTHWNLKGTVSDYYQNFGHNLPYRCVQNDYLPEYINYQKEFNDYRNCISPISDNMFINVVSNVSPRIDNSYQFKGSKPIEVFNCHALKDELQATDNILNNSNVCGRRELENDTTKLNNQLRKETSTGIKGTLETKPNEKSIHAPRRLKELIYNPERLNKFSEYPKNVCYNVKSLTELNPNSQEFIPSSMKPLKSNQYLERSDSIETPEVNNLSSELMTALTKNPVSVLHEFAQPRGMNCEYEVVEIAGPSHKPKISMYVNLNGRKFDTITAANKKEGKRLAADTAIRKLISEGHFAERISRLSSRAFNNDGDIHDVEIKASKNSVSLIDNMASLVYNEFSKLLKGLSPEDGVTLAGRKVVSAFIMQDEKHDTFQVVSLATGNRCISGDKISLQGQVVNDCHAEVVVRRAFNLFIYRQLLAQISETSASLDLFEKTISITRFKIKGHIKFHLYISTAPCGDAALFCNRENDHKKSESDIVLSKDHQPLFEHPVQGLLRSKIEGGEGTIPVNNSRQLYQIQSLDGILRGERLKTMSCSDKIARWNYLGIQGSLLTQIIEPIYIKSISLGNLYNAGHLSRALCCRLDRDKLHQKNIFEHVNHPDLGYVHVGSIQREIDKSNELSINWSYGLKLEVIDGVTGLLIGISEHQSACSRISKAKLFSQYMKLIESIDHSQYNKNLTYGETKLLSADYEKKKHKLYEIFHKLEYGSWIRKPLEQNSFRNINVYH